jgi:hypothetical protein
MKATADPTVPSVTTAASTIDSAISDSVDEVCGWEAFFSTSTVWGEMTAAVAGLCQARLAAVAAGKRDPIAVYHLSFLVEDERLLAKIRGADDSNEELDRLILGSLPADLGVVLHREGGADDILEQIENTAGCSGIIRINRNKLAAIVGDYDAGPDPSEAVSRLLRGRLEQVGGISLRGCDITNA